MKNNDIMTDILQHDCGKVENYSDFSADEVIADEVENSANNKFVVKNTEVIGAEVAEDGALIVNSAKSKFAVNNTKVVGAEVAENGVEYGKDLGQIKYRNTCDYTMVNPEVANSENTHVIDYSGS